MSRTILSLSIAAVFIGGLVSTASAQAYWPEGRGYQHHRHMGYYARGRVYGNGQYVGRDGGRAHFLATANGHNKYTTSGH